MTAEARLGVVLVPADAGVAGVSRRLGVVVTADAGELLEAGEPAVAAIAVGRRVSAGRNREEHLVLRTRHRCIADATTRRRGPSRCRTSPRQHIATQEGDQPCRNQDDGLHRHVPSSTQTHPEIRPPNARG